jgi:hemolysin III
MKITYTRENLFRYSKSEDIANAISHLIGIFIAILMLVVLNYQAGVTQNIAFSISGSFYVLCALAMFTSSTMYHAIRHEKSRLVLKILDHAMIFLLIIGTFTPFVFAINELNTYILYLILISVSLLGLYFKIFHPGKYKKTLTLMFLILGWSSLFLIPSINNKFGLVPIYYLLAGGISYSLGALIYALAKFKYHHLVWHFAIIIAVITQFMAVLEIN